MTIIIIGAGLQQSYDVWVKVRTDGGGQTDVRSYMYASLSITHIVSQDQADGDSSKTCALKPDTQVNHIFTLRHYLSLMPVFSSCLVFSFSSSRSLYSGAIMVQHSNQ